MLARRTILRDASCLIHARHKDQRMKILKQESSLLSDSSFTQWPYLLGGLCTVPRSTTRHVYSIFTFELLTKSSCNFKATKEQPRYVLVFIEAAQKSANTIIREKANRNVTNTTGTRC